MKSESGFRSEVSGNSRLPYKSVGISHEFLRQKGIPAHPWAVEVDQGELSTIILGMLESSGFQK